MSTMRLRFKEAWAARKDHRARVNAQLAATDAQIPSQLDQWDRRQPPEVQRANLEDGLAEPGTWEAS